MVSQIASALVRAILVAALVALPALLVPHVATDTAQIVVVIAMLGALLTFMEYYGRYPSIVEFRFAPPFNRLKYVTLVLGVGTLSLVERGQTDPSALTELLTALGRGLGHAIDFPYSPVRLMVLMLPADADIRLVEELRTAAGVSYLLSLTMLAVFITHVRFFNWPLRGRTFNVWVNMPLFDPTRGGDVVERLRRDAGVNVVLGALLPFLIPAAVKLTTQAIDPVSLANPQTLIWVITAWAFLPASLLVRGVALSRVADLIEAKRARFATEGGLERLQEA